MPQNNILINSIETYREKRLCKRNWYYFLDDEMIESVRSSSNSIINMGLIPEKEKFD